MALRLDPVRLLIADDVGVGKTIEAGMIARELLDRGTVRRIGVLCPPHLCEQWEEELRTKFNIDTAVIQSSRISRLERAMPRSDVSLYQHYRNLVVSIDFVKSDRNRQHFLDNAPDLIIMDEAHTAARPRGGRGGAQQQRYALARDLAKDPNRHVILTTATPHSGIEEGFRSLLGLLNPEFDSSEDADLPKAELTPHLIQRKRADLKRWLDVDTPFPERQAVERSYRMSADYHRLYQDILNYCREHVASKGMDEQRQRVRYWAALSILRCVLSSPWAARAALENRRPSRDQLRHDDSPGEGELSEELFGRQLVDSAEEDQATDYVPSVSFEDPDDTTNASEERRLSAFLRRAEALAGPEHDAKIRETVATVSGLLDEGYHPIVYCRFIQSAYYVADQLRSQLQSRHPGLRVSAATGNDGDGEQRKEIVLDLARHSTRVLVATDCLSEGVNLQEHYDAVIHYDLPWNPNRLEQRMGRIHRYGQEHEVHIVNLVANTTREGSVLVRLMEKLERMRAQLGHDQVYDVISSIFDAGSMRLDVLMREAILNRRSMEDILADMEFIGDPGAAAAIREALGSALATPHVDLSGIHQEERDSKERRLTPEFVERFFVDSLQYLGGRLTPGGDRDWRLDFIPAPIRQEARSHNTGEFGQENRLITFRKDRLRRDPPAEFVAPDHPLFDAVLRRMLEQGRPSLNSGTVFIDKRAREPYLVWLLEAAVRNGLGEEVHRRLLALRQRGDEFEPVQPGVLLDLPPSDAVPVVPGALRDMARDDAAVAEASAVYANEYLAEVTKDKNGR
jgi:superfamily II DNA or RNA helicase